MPAGRPSSYSTVMAEAICEGLAEGRSLVQVCLDPDFPEPRTVYRWLDAHEEFRLMYARARDRQAEHYAAEIIALADTPVEARKVVIKADGSEEITIGDAVERTRLQIDARKWYASKVAPKKFGDKVQHTGDADNPVVVRTLNDFYAGNS